MQQNKTTWGILYRAQSGTTLVLGLIMLLILTILGVSSVSTSQLQLKMASNTRDKTRSFIKAEDARLAAERLATQLGDGIRFSGTNFDCSNLGYFAAPAEPNTVNCTGLVADVKTHSWTTDSMNVSGSKDRYIIEYLGSREVVMPTDTARGTGGQLTKTANAFRLTVRGEGDDGAITYIQAVYMRI